MFLKLNGVSETELCFENRIVFLKTELCFRKIKLRFDTSGFVILYFRKSQYLSRKYNLF